MSVHSVILEYRAHTHTHTHTLASHLTDKARRHKENENVISSENGNLVWLIVPY